jgi:hypothetical protein
MTPTVKTSPDLLKRVGKMLELKGYVHNQSALGSDPIAAAKAFIINAQKRMQVKTADVDPAPLATRDFVDTAKSNPSIAEQAAESRKKLYELYGQGWKSHGLSAMVDRMKKSPLIKRASQIERELQDIEINNDGWRQWFHSMNKQDTVITSRVPPKKNVTENWTYAGYKKASLDSKLLGNIRQVSITNKLSKAITPEMGNVMQKATPETAGTVAQASQQILKHAGMRPPIEPSIEALKNLAVKGKQEFALYKLHNAQMRTAKGNNPLRSTKSIARKALKQNEKTSGLIPGGLADKAHKKPSDFDPKQIAMGVKVEQEHTPDPKKAKEIAMDHLTEFPKYYTALDKMEKDLKKKAFIEKAAISLTRLQQAGIATSERLRALPHGAPERQRLMNFSNKLYDAVTTKRSEIDQKVLQARAAGASWVPNRFKMK